MEYIASGAVAGLTVDVVLFPIDTIKTRMQSRKGFANAGGFQSLYRGLSAVSIGSVPSAALFFGTYELVKNDGPFSLHGNQLLGAIVGETASGVVRVPLDTLKQRMQVGNSASLRTAASTRSSKELFQALPVTLMRDIPFAASQMLLYEFLKSNGVPVWISGLIAGAVSGFVTTPLDVVRTRLMLVEAEGSVPRVLESLWKEGGMSTVFRGASMRSLWISAGGCVFFSAYESARCFFR
jgi:solute carrier family 25 (mitochondrial S-adenosylmethionine transporter), member 26